MALGNLGQATFEEGDYGAARPLLREAIAELWALGDQASVLYLLELYAALLTALGEPERAALLFGATETLRGAMGIPLDAPDVARYERDVALTKGALSEAWKEAWAEGGTLPLERAVVVALEEQP